jgi:hypothetical protein
MSLFCGRGFCDNLAAFVDALFFGAQPKKTDIELDSWGTASPAARSSNGSDSFEDWCLYGAGTVAQEASDSQGGNAPRL